MKPRPFVLTGDDCAVIYRRKTDSFEMLLPRKEGETGNEAVPHKAALITVFAAKIQSEQAFRDEMSNRLFPS